MTGVCKDAVLKLIRDMGAACAEHHNSVVRNVKAARVQCDEIWSFCYAKEKNVPVEKEGTGAGSVWTWTDSGRQLKRWTIPRFRGLAIN